MPGGAEVAVTSEEVAVRSPRDPAAVAAFTRAEWWGLAAYANGGDKACREPREVPPHWWDGGVPDGWHLWKGVNGRFYGRLLRSSPPVVAEAGTPAELGRKIAACPHRW